MLETFDDLVKQLAPDVRVREFSAPETDRHLHLLAFFEEALDGFRLEVEVVIIRLGAEPHLLEEDDLLVLTSFALFLLLVVLEAAVVEQPANWRRGGRRYFDKIEAPLSGDTKCIGGVEDSELLPVFADQADLRDPDPFVYA